MHAYVLVLVESIRYLIFEVAVKGAIRGEE